MGEKLRILLQVNLVRVVLKYLSREFASVFRTHEIAKLGKLLCHIRRDLLLLRLFIVLLIVTLCIFSLQFL
jgi:hypothetical protein